MCTAEAVAEALVSVYCRVGIPSEVLSDQGRQFMSQCMQHVSTLLNFKQLVTTPYHPMCNGLVESFNATLKRMLKRMCAEQPNEWHNYIDPLLFAYREVPQESTTFSPFELLYGRAVRGPLAILKELWTEDRDEDEIKTSYQYVVDLKARLCDTMQLVQDELKKSQVRNKKYYDKRTKQRKIQPGDEVLVLLPNYKNKLQMQWKGPYVVKNEPHKNNFKVKVNNRLKTYHINLLKKYERRSPDLMENTDCTCSALAIIEDEADVNEQDGDQFKYINLESVETWKDVEINNELRKDQKLSLYDILEKYKAQFTDLPGETKIIEHKIEVTSKDPVLTRPYPVPYALRETLQLELNKMEKMGIIRRSESPYASSIVLVKKKDSSLRICTDFRKLNKVTIFDPEPMISSNDILHKVQRARFFTKLDLSKGYWQIKMREEDIQKTSFVTPYGQYEWLRMPFGLMNSGATLVRGLRKLFDGVDNVECYIDDILIHNETWNDHLQSIQSVLQLLKTENFTIRPAKCMFGYTSIEYLGQTLSNGTVSPNISNNDKIASAPQPTTKKQVQSFLGLTGYYRDFINNYAKLASPLTDLLKKNVPNKIVWSKILEESFNSLKQALATNPILKIPDPRKPFTLRTDASNTSLGAVLLQDHNCTLFPVGYASRKLTEREKTYSISEKECLAIVFGCQKYNNYLCGTHFTLETDHGCLKYLDETKFTNPRLMRWAILLQNYRMTIKYIKGSHNIGAD